MARSSEAGRSRDEARAFPQPSFSFNVKHAQHGAEHTQADGATKLGDITTIQSDMKPKKNAGNEAKSRRTTTSILTGIRPRSGLIVTSPSL